MKAKWIGCLTLVALLAGCSPSSDKKELADYVNPFIGTGGHGHTYPGAVVPHGMIQPSPDTRVFGWDACSGYYYEDSSINGFSHTHLSGTGCGDYGDVLLMPTVGEQKLGNAFDGKQTLPYASAFSHEKEVAAPGYYSVFLDTYGVKAELAATKRAAIHRYTFPESAESGFILDLDHNLQEQKNKVLEIEVINDSTIRGHKNTEGWAVDQDVYFYAVFSKPFAYTMVDETVSTPKGEQPVKKALLHFGTAKDEQVLVKLALSAVDMEGAQKNLETEIPAWDFEKVRADARKDWNDFLAKIEITTDNEEQKKVFYTALYHTGVVPNLFTDADGRYRGIDRKIHLSEEGKPMYTVFSLWDTFRAYHPLLTIVDPKLNTDFVNTLITQYKEGGILPMWELAGNYTGTMIGYHGVSVIVDAYMKGYRDFNIEDAYKACLRSGEYDSVAPIITTRNLKDNALMPMSKYYKNTLGYVPCDKEHESVAKALEYAYNDWCISQFAESMGDVATQQKYAKLGKAYERYFDKSIRFMRGVDSKGEWRTPFNPRSSNHREDDYCEGTAWQWTWFVPHDVEGLVNLMGGKEPFIGKLDSLFTADSALEGDLVSADISGLIGQYAHGNEPSHHIVHLYNYVGQPWKTQELVDNVLHNQYFNDPNGLSGNEDCGQMSAWYILNSIGFYQVCPGNPTYSIGRPLFNEVKINLPDGKTFEVVAKNNTAQNKYIESVTLNGQPLSTPFFTHKDITSGGKMEIVMTDKPTEWGVN